MYGVGLFKDHTLGLGGHILGVLAGLSLVGKIHVHGLRGVAQDLVELEGFGANHSQCLLSDRPRESARANHLRCKHHATHPCLALTSPRNREIRSSTSEKSYSTHSGE